MENSFTQKETGMFGKKNKWVILMLFLETRVPIYIVDAAFAPRVVVIGIGKTSVTRKDHAALLDLSPGSPDIRFGDE